MQDKKRKIYEFGSFRLDISERLFWRDGEPMTLTPKVFDLLALLIENHGHLLKKDEIIKELWADSFVEEANLNVNISALRRAIGETPTEHKFIETVPRRGYRFVAEVREIEDSENPENEILTAAVEKSEKKQDSKPATPADDISNAILSRIKKRRSLAGKKKLLLLIGVLIIAAMGIFVWRLAKQTIIQPDVAQLKTIAILPFKPLTKGQNDEVLEMGMADALITKLSNLQQITVRPTSAILKYSTADIDSLAAGRELQVDAVLEGKIQRLENKIRVSVQMLRVSDGATLWAESFDDYFTNIFAVQDSISEKLTTSLALKISGKEKELLAKRHTENTEAYQLYLQGRYYHEQISREGSLKAIEFYERAVQKDPEYALAYAWMTGALEHLVNLNINREENLQKARNAAENAARLDPNLPDAHEALATIKDTFDWNWAEAEKEYLKAIEVDSKNADAHFSYSLFLSRFKRHNEAVREVETARQLNPTVMYIQNQVVQTLIRARRFEEAIAEAQKAIELKPDNIQAYGQLVKLYVLKSMPNEAEKVLKKYLEFDLQGKESMTAFVYMNSGRKNEAEKILRELAGKYKEGDNCTIYALYYLWLGDKDRTFELLEKAYKRREAALIMLNVETDWDELHSDPRFQDLIRRIGLPL